MAPEAIGEGHFFGRDVLDSCHVARSHESKPMQRQFEIGSDRIDGLDNFPLWLDRRRTGIVTYYLEKNGYRKYVIGIVNS